MDTFLITTHEQVRIEAATPETTAPQKVRFSFHIGYDVFLAVTAEVTEEYDGDGYTGHDVTILECVEDNGAFVVPVYHKGCEFLRSEIERKAVECSHNSKYHIKN